MVRINVGLYLRESPQFWKNFAEPEMQTGNQIEETLKKHNARLERVEYSSSTPDELPWRYDLVFDTEGDYIVFKIKYS